MKKLYLLDVIEKYHLGGLVERVKISVNNKTLTSKFIATNKNLIGEITAPNIELEDCEFGVYDTSQLLKLLGITDKLLTLNIEKKGKIANKLLIADADYNLEYTLADTMLTPSIPSFDEPSYDMEANIDKEFIDKFVKAKKALTTDIFTISSGADTKSERDSHPQLSAVNHHATTSDPYKHSQGELNKCHTLTKLLSAVMQ